MFCRSAIAIRERVGSDDVHTHTASTSSERNLMTMVSIKCRRHRFVNKYEYNKYCSEH